MTLWIAPYVTNTQKLKLVVCTFTSMSHNLWKICWLLLYNISVEWLVKWTWMMDGWIWSMFNLQQQQLLLQQQQQQQQQHLLEMSSRNHHAVLPSWRSTTWWNYQQRQYTWDCNNTVNINKTHHSLIHSFMPKNNWNVHVSYKSNIMAGPG